MRYWKRVDDAGLIRTVEAYSHSLDIGGAIEITKGDFDLYVGNLPVPEALPVFNPELEAIKQRLNTIESKLNIATLQ